MTAVAGLASFFTGWDDRDRRSPAIHVLFPAGTNAHTLRAAIHRLAAEVDDASPAAEDWYTEVGFYWPNEERTLGLGGRITVRLASYTEPEVAAETARVLDLFETVLARHRR